MFGIVMVMRGMGQPMSVPEEPVPIESRLHKAIEGFVALAGVLAVIVFALAVIGWILDALSHGASRIADAIYIPANLPHEALWAMFGIYGCVLLAMATRAARGQSWATEMFLYGFSLAAGILFVVFLLVPATVEWDSANVSARHGLQFSHYRVDCGSFLSQAAGADKQECDPKYNSASRWAITIAAAGLAVPFAVSAKAEYDTRKKSRSGE